MTPESFIAKWSANTGTERAAAQSHFNDLCSLLNEPNPHEADPTGTDYAFEKGVQKSGSGRGFADVWRRNHFALEYKRKGADLNAAFIQLQRYALALDNPPLLVVSDIDTIIIRTAWTNTISETHTITLAEIANPLRRQLLKWMLSDPEQLRPKKTRQALTEEAAKTFASLAQQLRDRGNDAKAVAHFINRIVFCLFADHADLLPAGLLEKVFSIARKYPHKSDTYFSQLFGAMATQNSQVGFIDIPWFNGGLFDDDAAIALRSQDVRILQDIRALKWDDIDVAIFGTLFERGLDPDKRSQLGAHYTNREKIDLIINPVIVRPLRAEWAAAHANIEAALSAKGTRPKQRANAQAIYQAFLDRLAAFRVLDPACGSGNFLYLAVQALQDIEHLANIEAEALGLQRVFARVGPQAAYGIDINEFAVELARVSVWIGHIQWARRNGVPPPSDPVLGRLDTIECRDSVLSPDGTPAKWPAVDVIVGNPPFLGDKKMRTILGDAETERLRSAYVGRVSGGADLVCFWFDLAREAVVKRRASRVGFVATQSIRKGASREVLDAIVYDAIIFDAWGDEAWTVDGAFVRVSLVCFSRERLFPTRLDGAVVDAIAADLGAKSAALTAAQVLSDNRHVCFQGPVKVGPFNIDGQLARMLIEEPLNPNGLSNAIVVRPWLNARGLTQRAADLWIIDFNSMDQREAQLFAKPFGHVFKHVKPKREENRRASRSSRWWLHGETVPGLRKAVGQVTRVIATPRVAKHRIFAWISKAVLPDSRIYVFARDDDTTFGILQSRFHESWSLKLGSRHGVGNDPTYNNQTCFETFPFPENLTPNIPAATYAQNPHAIAIANAARALTEARDRWLNPENLTDRVPDILPHLPHRIIPKSPAAAQQLKTRTLTNLYNSRGKPEGAWLDALHTDLDAAVAAAYGWPPTISEPDALAALLALNLTRASQPKPTVIVADPPCQPFASEKNLLRPQTTQRRR